MSYSISSCGFLISGPLYTVPCSFYALFAIPLLSSLTLTSPLFFHAPLTLLLTPFGFLHFLVLAALVEVLHHYADKHVEDKEANDEEERDEIQQHPWVVVGHRLGLKWGVCS